MSAKELTAVSLFAGVGGFDLAMQRNGIKVVATVEIDKNARGVLQHQFPEATHFEDVTKVSGDDLRRAGFVPRHGIITGGFPCQDLSVAGKRAGLAGQRSGLYWEIVRLVDELAPKYLVLENVPGLLSSNGGRDMGVVIGALTNRGYGVSWRVLDAQYVEWPCDVIKVLDATENLKFNDLKTKVECDHAIAIALHGKVECDHAIAIALHGTDPVGTNFNFCPKCGDSL